MLDDFKLQNGQSLLEVVISIAVTGIVMGGIVLIIINGLRNAQFAQNQSLATKFATEAVDQIRSIRDGDKNGSIFVKNDSSITKFSDLWKSQLSSLSSPCTTQDQEIPDRRGCYFFLNQNSSSPTLSEVLSDDQVFAPVKNNLSREIFITDTSVDFGFEKSMTVRVRWTDATGTHESNLQTVLTKLQ